METRKHLPRAVLARIYFIDRQIASEKYPNVHFLAKELHGSMYDTYITYLIFLKWKNRNFSRSI